MEHRPAGIVRERVSRLTGSRVSTTLVLDRDLETDELAKFYRLPADGVPGPADFLIEGRVVRYECESDDTAKWRLAMEVYLAKALGDPPPAPRWSTGIRERAGLRKLHLG